MKKLLLILIWVPFFSLGQNKKELKKIIVQYKDSIIDLEDVIDSYKTREIISNKEINELTNEIKNLKDRQSNFAQKFDTLNSEKIKLSDEKISLETQRLILEDSINNLILIQDYLLTVQDSLLNVKVSNEISLKDIISDSKFSKKTLVGSWSLKTLVFNKEDEYIDYDDVYNYSRDDDYDYKYESKKSVINKITFMEPNISVIELKDGTKMSCLFQIDDERKSGYKNSIFLKFVDHDREVLIFTISEFGGAYIFNYSFNSLKYFFDREDYKNKITELRVKGVKYDNKWQVYDDYNLHIIGVFK